MQTQVQVQSQTQVQTQVQTYHFNEIVNKEGAVTLLGLPPMEEVIIVVIHPKPLSWQEELKQLMVDIRKDHPFTKMSKEEILVKLRQTREEVYDELYGDMYDD